MGKKSIQAAAYNGKHTLYIVLFPLLSTFRNGNSVPGQRYIHVVHCNNKDCSLLDIHTMTLLAIINPSTVALLVIN